MYQNIILNKPLVSVNWLKNHLKSPNLVILDASMKKATDTDSGLTAIQIPKARFFDIKNVFSNIEDPFPNAVPKEEHFTKEAQKLGINRDSAIVVYDDKGIYSSARAWWLFKAFGHNNVAVLDGGLPEWIKHEYQTEPKQAKENQTGDFIGSFNPKYFNFFEDILQSINNDHELIFDARSSDRFHGLVKEPRDGLRSGHIPNSDSLPYSQLKDGNKLKSKDELINIFNTFDCQNKNLIFSCGSGITACILALGATIAGYNNVSVYDGSWTEYGTLTKE